MLLCTLNTRLTLPWNLIWCSWKRNNDTWGCRGNLSIFIYTGCSMQAVKLHTELCYNKCANKANQPTSFPVFPVQKTKFKSILTFCGCKCFNEVFFLSVLSQIGIWIPVLALLGEGARPHSSGSSLGEKHQLHLSLLANLLLSSQKMLFQAQC